VSPSENERLEQLESKLAYLERGNQELGDVVYRQQQAMDALTARLERLADLLQAVAERPRDYSAEEEKPPHY
jgi:SlyX protein